ncbi:Uma2 family endonuclease [Streptomyces sp. NPDC052682]|uniref:Uma2 family endonuclease n=1 Tax=Streptomyces sp. NPDC052682 TaxID=3154954 RepID=UPI003431F35A
MEYARMRAIAEELWAHAERLEGAWRVEIGPSGPVLAMAWPSKRHAGTVRRIRDQLNRQLPATHPGHICANGPVIEHAVRGRMRRPDAVVIPESVLDEGGLAVDALRVLAVVEVVRPPGLGGDRAERLGDCSAMGVPHCLVVDPRTGTIEVYSDPCRAGYARKDAYIYGDSVRFGPWTIATSEFRRYGKPGE